MRATYEKDLVITDGLWVDARAYGDSLNDTTLQAAITALGSDEKKLVITPGDWSITDDVTVPSNISLRVELGAVFEIATGKTLTIYSPENIDVGDRQKIFDGAGVVEFSNPGIISPGWYGTLGDGSTNDNAAMQKAVTSAISVAGCVLKLPLGQYLLTGITIPAGTEDLSVVGDAYNLTKITPHSTHDDSAAMFLVGATGTTSDRIMFKNLWFYQGGSSYTDNTQSPALKFVSTNNVTIEDCHFNRFQNAIHANDSDDMRIIGDIKTMSCGYYGSGEGVIHLIDPNTIFIQGTTIERSYDYGIYIEKSGATIGSGVHIQGNKLHGRTDSDGDSEYMKSLIMIDGANNVLIQGNIISNVRGETAGPVYIPGIVIRDEDGVTAGTGEKTHTNIIGNSIEGANTHTMIQVDVGDPLSRVIIDGNSFSDEFTSGEAIEVCANVLPQNLIIGPNNTSNEEYNLSDFISLGATSTGFGGSFWYEYTETISMDASPGQATYSCFTVPTGFSWVPVIAQVRMDTNVKATNGDYLGLGVNGANRRVDFGVSTIAADSKWAQNVKFQKFLSLSDDVQVVAAGEIVKLMCVDGITDAAAQSGNTFGDTGQTITVKISGWFVSDLPDL